MSLSLIYMYISIDKMQLSDEEQQLGVCCVAAHEHGTTVGIYVIAAVVKHLYLRNLRLHHLGKLAIAN